MAKRKRKSKKSKADRLQEIYDSLPTIECKGKCWQACGPIPLTTLELKLLNRARLTPIHADDILEVSRNRSVLTAGIDIHGEIRCPALAGNRCSAHPGRPMICRLYGMVQNEKMICPHGCEPTRWLSDRESFELVKEVERLQ